MGKVIAFEGISGSGKSTLIKSIKNEIIGVKDITWFDNDLIRKLLYDVEKKVNVTRDIFSLCYAIEFLGKYRYQIEPLLDEDLLLLHRYYYTPLTHDVVRGTSQSKLKEWYEHENIREPDTIVYLDVSPETAIKRILSYRKPTFYECGLDKYSYGSLAETKRKYERNEISLAQLTECFVKFQTEVSKEYRRLFADNEKVLWITEEETIDESMNKVLMHIYPKTSEYSGVH